MKDQKDVFGKELMGFYRNESQREIIERNDGLIIASDLYGKKAWFSKYENWAPYEKKAVRWVKGRVLDIGCGAGRHSIYLQKKGFDVLGIDNSPLAVRISRLRGLKKARVLAIEKLSRLKTGSFDTVLMMGQNFGLFGSFLKAKRLLKEIDRITSPGALLIVETLDPHQTKNRVHLDYYRSNTRRGRMPGQMRFRVRYQNLIGPWFDYLYVSEMEMKKILQGTGWFLKKIFLSKNSHYSGIIQKQ